MTILAVDCDAADLSKLAECLQTVFPRDKIAPFSDPLAALQYVFSHPGEITAVFTAILLRGLDGISLAKSLRRTAPDTKIYFTVQSGSQELAAVALQHGDGHCLQKPMTVEAIRAAADCVQAPCLLEEESCGIGCSCSWCGHTEQYVCQNEGTPI